MTAASTGCSRALIGKKIGPVRGEVAEFVRFREIETQGQAGQDLPQREDVGAGVVMAE